MKSKYLLFGAICCFIAALLHLGCIVFGAQWYRFFGAGEHMARMAEDGLLEPTIVTSMIVLMLTVWGVYGLSGFGVIPRLPFQKLVLGLIACALMLRGIGFPLFMSSFPENTLTFWLISSSICLIMGTCFAIGTLSLVKGTSKSE
ncbi:hypothetical protein [Pseudoalteromonas luteoviolacea]|uniref:Uncharacterized protein n=1 Tax=Pseudoalteromonas luteoviolacea S4060-1 TaxID=1365257 RepID=A0A167IJV6_9GAMM|nr:hypothetical protein [Pseudoalteromonas luteoviolacea]KZN59628.1 hypothetical protein N478_07895 [Pseudoalteromonas luteoviolacea S4060-1]